MRQGQLLIPALLLLFLQLSFVNPSSFTNTNAVENTEHCTSKVVSEGMSISISKRNSPLSLSKAYDVYIVVTPFENNIGRAVAEELSRQLSKSTTSKDNEGSATNVICMLRCPPGATHTSKSIDGPTNTMLPFKLYRLLQQVKELYKAIKRMVVRDLEYENQRWLRRFSNQSPTIVLPSKAEFDPFGNPSSIRKSCEACLTEIQRELLQFTATESNATRNDTLSAKINLRGILFNPYGCPPTDTDRSQKAILPNHSLSPLGAYKLLSTAIFTDLAISTRSTMIQIPVADIEKTQDYKSSAVDSIDEETPSLRIITVGTEAARGLPGMGIPVPNLKDATDSIIRKKLLLDGPFHSESRSNWEEKYAEMSALAVLYFKALETKTQTAIHNLYLGTISPGMTPESFNIAHVPRAARILAFRIKLWLCRRRWVFEFLQKCEIAKSTEQAGSLLATALLNAPIDTNQKPNDSKQSREKVQWDDLYPSGSFVGAKSGTGGPLCEQSLLVYNATNNKVSLASSDESEFHGKEEKMNFLANQQLQDLVYQTVQRIIAEGNY